MQPLWAVHIRWDCKRGSGSNGLDFSDHEVIVDAEGSRQAQQRAIEWLRQNHPCTESPQIEMRVTDAKEIEHIWVYNDSRVPAKVKYTEKQDRGRI